LNGCGTYEPLIGWCRCVEYVHGDAIAAPAVHMRGRATARQLFTDTQSFRDKAVKDAAAKARRR
jgi:hypothetical protein